MSGKTQFGRNANGSSRENIAYVRQMLAELAHVARNEKADLLAYLLEMAYTEASDLLSDRLEPGKIQGDHAARVAVKPAGKV